MFEQKVGQTYIQAKNLNAKNLEKVTRLLQQKDGVVSVTYDQAQQHFEVVAHAKDQSDLETVSKGFVRAVQGAGVTAKEEKKPLFLEQDGVHRPVGPGQAGFDVPLAGRTNAGAAGAVVDNDGLMRPRHQGVMLEQDGVHRPVGPGQAGFDVPLAGRTNAGAAGAVVDNDGLMRPRHQGVMLEQDGVHRPVGPGIAAGGGTNVQHAGLVAGNVALSGGGTNVQHAGLVAGNVALSGDPNQV